MRYVPSREAEKILGVSQQSLRAWGDKGKINVKRTPGGKRLYDVESFVGQASPTGTICYCRVSSTKQRDDLERQVAYMRQRYPTHDIITDVASGLNFKRKGLITLLERVCRREIKEVVVAHKDRLARFGFDLIKWLIEYHGGNIVVLNETAVSPQSELVADILAILTVFSCRMHGLRKYRQEIAEDTALPQQSTETNVEALDGDSQVCL